MKNNAGYSGMAFELLILILIMLFIGKKIDSWLGLEKPIMLVIFVCLGMIAYMVKIYFETNKNDENEK
jgi:F0F1-type ATP synthase assembly protein I